MSERNNLRKRENTRAQLIAAGTEVFLDKGLSGARIDDVVRASGFTRGAFYSNYSAMEDLMRDVIRTKSEQVFAQVTNVFAEISDPPQIDDIVAVVSKLRPVGREMYILITEYTLYQMRHKIAAEFSLLAGTSPAEFVGQLMRDVLQRMGRVSVVPTQVLAQVLSVLFMDSVVAQELGSEQRTSPELFDDVVRSMIEALTEPVERQDGTSGNAMIPQRAVERLVQFSQKHPYPVPSHGVDAE